MPSSSEEVLRTVADELLELVKKSGRISIDEAAKKLKISIDTVQALADFLIEERIFGIEYKFTTPYLYLYKEGITEAKAKEKGITEKLVTKEQFYKKAKEKNILHENIGVLWRKYMQQNMEHIREEFLRKCKEKKIPHDKVDELWKKYLSYL